MSISSQEYISIYNGYNADSSSYVYNTNGSTTSEAGWYEAQYDDVIVGIRIATLNATSVDYRIEGRGAGNYTDPIVIFSDSLTATDPTVATPINIMEKVKQIRLGVKITTTATPNNVYAGLILSDYI